jgi:hypothetical protein
MLVGALVFFVVSTWDLLVYQRSQIRRTQDTGQLQGAKLNELPANTQVPESVTEQTTRLLDNAEYHSANETQDPP